MPLMMTPRRPAANPPGTVGPVNERPWDPATYDQAWSRMAAAGQDPHGEASFVSRALVRLGLRGPGGAPTVLDAGCGTGRVAIELERRGMSVTGTDVDSTMLEAARRKAPHLRWIEADLSTLELGERFDTVVMAGNVILFVHPDSRPAVLPALARHLEPGGILIAGFQLARPDGRRVALDLWDAWATTAGLQLVERFATWDEDAWDPGADYAVSVHRLGPG
jgi:SAM-dependent methyltransferase